MTGRRFGGLVIVMALLGACGSDADQRSRSASAAHDRPTVEDPDRRTIGQPTESDAVPLTGAAQAADNGFGSLTGARVGLIAHSASTVDGVHLADLLDADPEVELVALFGPEHGIRSDVGAGIDVTDSVDAATGVPVYSLYGDRRAPTTDMVAELDALVYDLQDIGTRYYTYVSTMGLAMQAAAEAGIRFVVFDRPNPHGTRVAGTVLEPGNESFVGQYPIAELYGLTAGELAGAIVGEGWLPGLENLDLEIVELSGWSGGPIEPAAEQDWLPPSPAIVDAETALVYPALVLFEATSFTFGRGTELPYRLVGSPDIDAAALAAEMNALGLPGVEFEAISITPTPSSDPRVVHAYAGVTVPAVTVSVTDPASFRPTEVAVRFLVRIVSLIGPDTIVRPEWLDLLSGSTDLRMALERGVAAEVILADRIDRLEAFEKVIERYRRY